MRANKRIDEAKFSVLRSAMMGNMKAYNLMGLMVKDQRDHSDTIVLNLIRVSALLGYSSALSNLGAYYEQGEYGLPVDYDMAESYYLAATEAGSKKASEYLEELRKKRDASNK